MGAIIFRVLTVFFMTFMELKGIITNFAFQLGTFFPIVKVNILMRSFTEWTGYNFRYPGFLIPGFNWFKRFVMNSNPFIENYLVVLSFLIFSFFFELGLSVNGGAGSTENSL